MDIRHLTKILKHHAGHIACDSPYRTSALEEIFGMLGLVANRLDPDLIDGTLTTWIDVGPTTDTTPETFSIPEIPESALKLIHDHLNLLMHHKVQDASSSDPVWFGDYACDQCESCQLGICARPLVLVKLIESGFFGRCLGSHNLTLHPGLPPYTTRSAKYWKSVCNSPTGLLTALEAMQARGWWTTPINPDLLKAYFTSKDRRYLLKMRQSDLSKVKPFANLDVTEWAISRSGLSPEEFQVLARSYGVRDLSNTPILLGYLAPEPGESYLGHGARSTVFSTPGMWEFCHSSTISHLITSPEFWNYILMDIYRIQVRANRTNHLTEPKWWKQLSTKKTRG